MSARKQNQSKAKLRRAEHKCQRAEARAAIKATDRTKLKTSVHADGSCYCSGCMVHSPLVSQCRVQKCPLRNVLKRSPIARRMYNGVYGGEGQIGSVPSKLSLYEMLEGYGDVLERKARKRR